MRKEMTRKELLEKLRLSMSNIQSIIDDLIKDEVVTERKESSGTYYSLKEIKKENTERTLKRTSGVKSMETGNSDQDRVKSQREIDISQELGIAACSLMHTEHNKDYMEINSIKRHPLDRPFRCNNCQSIIPFYKPIYGFWYHRFCSPQCRDTWKSVKENRKKKCDCSHLEKCMRSPNWDPEAKIP